MKEKIVFCWSGGKDSALALNRLLQDGRYEVVSLLTTCNEHFQRVSMHGVRLELLEQQAAAIGLPLEKVFVSQRSSNEEYQQKMSACLLGAPGARRDRLRVWRHFSRRPQDAGARKIWRRSACAEFFRSGKLIRAN